MSLVLLLLLEDLSLGDARLEGTIIMLSIDPLKKALVGLGGLAPLIPCSSNSIAIVGFLYEQETLRVFCRVVIRFPSCCTDFTKMITTTESNATRATRT